MLPVLQCHKPSMKTPVFKITFIAEGCVQKAFREYNMNEDWGTELQYTELWIQPRLFWHLSKRETYSCFVCVCFFLNHTFCFCSVHASTLRFNLECSQLFLMRTGIHQMCTESCLSFINSPAPPCLLGWRASSGKHCDPEGALSLLTECKVAVLHRTPPSADFKSQAHHEN